jgi:hypothetical protein
LELLELPVLLRGYRCVSRRLLSHPYLPLWYPIFATAHGEKNKKLNLDRSDRRPSFLVLKSHRIVFFCFFLHGQLRRSSSTMEGFFRFFHVFNNGKCFSVVLPANTFVLLTPHESTVVGTHLTPPEYLSSHRRGLLHTAVQSDSSFAVLCARHYTILITAKSPLWSASQLGVLGMTPKK